MNLCFHVDQTMRQKQRDKGLQSKLLEIMQYLFRPVWYIQLKRPLQIPHKTNRFHVHCTCCIVIEFLRPSLHFASVLLNKLNSLPFLYTAVNFCKFVVSVSRVILCMLSICIKNYFVIPCQYNHTELNSVYLHKSNLCFDIAVFKLHSGFQGMTRCVEGRYLNKCSDFRLEMNYIECRETNSFSFEIYLWKFLSLATY